MGPASLVQTLKEVQAVGLEHALAGKQAAGHAEAGVAEQGGSYQQQTESFCPIGGLENQSGEDCGARWGWE